MTVRRIILHMLTLLLIYMTMSIALPICRVNAEETQDDSNGDVEVKSPSAILMEAESGEVIYEKNCDTAMTPASVTKVMTLLLTFEALDQGKMTLEDMVTVSEHAASMGGSQCFFEAGEEQSVENMIKCIIIASGNDAAIAMAEKIAGSETAFVNMMNEKAKELGMKDATFVNACGLDVDGHKMSARDIAIMSRELVNKYPQVLDYSGIWMDHIIHKTARGESRFDLVNTNKFLNMYTGATGLKTGYTSTAKYCMSASASRDGINMIAVIMGGETKDIRNEDACRLLDYGYSRCHKYIDSNVMKEKKISIDKGTEDYVKITTAKQFEGVLLGDESPDSVKKKVDIPSSITAPVEKGEKLGEIVYYSGNRCLGKIPIYAGQSMDEMNMGYAINKVFRRMIL